MAELLKRVKRESNSNKVLGRDILCYINGGASATEAAPNWVLFGAQTSGDYDMSADSIDASSKDSDGWGETLQGMKSTELDLECICTTSDQGNEALKDAFIKGEEVDIVRWSKQTGKAVRNWYAITDYKESAPHDDVATISVTLNGAGKPKFYSNVTTIDVVKDGAEDKEEETTTTTAGSN